MIEDPRFTRKQAAAYLGVARQTLARWASTGRYALPYYKAGKKVIYLRSDLDNFLAQRRRGQ